jgi:hypothetical protein
VKPSQGVHEAGPSLQNEKTCHWMYARVSLKPRDIREQMQKQVERVRSDPPLAAPSSLTGWVGIRGIALFYLLSLKFGRQLVPAKGT